jgi:hypothetical protein
MPSLVVSFLDYDNDGDLDIYMVSDKGINNPVVNNVLWRNDGAGCTHWCFTDVSFQAGADANVDGMGLGVSDYDHDGDLDLYFSNNGSAVLLQNQTIQGEPIFVDVSLEAGVAFDATHWGTSFFDYNNDGWPDIYLATMETAPSLQNRLFHNGANGTFADISLMNGAGVPGASLGTAHADYDNDGWMDFVVGNSDEAYYLFRNRGLVGAGNHWVRVVLSGRGPVNRDAIGARVIIETGDGFRQMQEVKSGSSFGSGNDLALHFGLGQETLAQATVIWPDGLEESYASIPIDQEWHVAYPFTDLALTDGYTLTAEANSVVTFTHMITNSGTRPDTFEMTFTSTQGWAELSHTSISLDPAEAREIYVVINVADVTGVIDQTILTVTSAIDPAVSLSVVDTTEVREVFYFHFLSVVYR